MSGSTRKKSAPTIIDIAQLSGLSKSTVAMALKGSPLIKPETSAKVLEAARKLGYVYNRNAASLRQKSSNVVGLVIHDLLNPFFVEMLIGAERVLLDAGYLTLMAHTAERLDVQTKVLNSMREHNAAGILMCPVFDSPASVAQELRNTAMPLVLVMRPLDDDGCDEVGCENIRGMQQATQHLIELGHRRIAFAGRRFGGRVSADRLQGYRQAMQAAGLPVQEEWMLDVPITGSGGRQGLTLINNMAQRPTAVVCYNDAVALGVLNELDSQGARAGRDLAVVGFDGIELAAHATPPLTTMAVEPRELGEIASRILLSRITGQDTSEVPKKYFAVPRLVVRESSGLPLPR